MLQVAQEFASLLDQARFEEAGKLLSEDCNYQYWEGNYRGRDTIVNIYKQMQKSAEQEFDELKFASEVEPTGDDRFTVHFTDSVRIGSNWHPLRYDAILQTKNGHIVSIEHQEIAGEQRKFQGFLQRAGRIAPR